MVTPPLRTENECGREFGGGNCQLAELKTYTLSVENVVTTWEREVVLGIAIRIWGFSFFAVHSTVR